MITRVRGNQVVMVVDLQKVTVNNEVGVSKTGIVLAAGDEIVLRLVGRETTYIYTPVWAVGDTKIIATDNGKLPTGKYGLEVVIKTVDGTRYRAMHQDVIKVVETNDAVGLILSQEPDEEEDTTIETENLEAQVLTDGTTIIINKSGISEDRVREILDEEGIPEAINSLREDVDQARDDVNDRVKIAVTRRTDTNEKEYIIRRTNMATGEENAVALTWDGDGFNFYTGEDSRKPTIDGKKIATTEDMPDVSGKVDKAGELTDETLIERGSVSVKTYGVDEELELNANKLSLHADDIEINGGTFVEAVVNSLSFMSEYDSDKNKIATANELDGYVKKVDGMGLVSDADKAKLDGIEEGAEANVQSDWNETDEEADSFVIGKPTKLSDFENDEEFFGTSDVASVNEIVNLFT